MTSSNPNDLPKAPPLNTIKWWICGLFPKHEWRKTFRKHGGALDSWRARSSLSPHPVSLTKLSWSLRQIKSPPHSENTEFPRGLQVGTKGWLFSGTSTPLALGAFGTTCMLAVSVFESCLRTNFPLSYWVSGWALSSLCIYHADTGNNHPEFSRPERSTFKFFSGKCFLDNWQPSNFSRSHPLPSPDTPKSCSPFSYQQQRPHREAQAATPASHSPHHCSWSSSFQNPACSWMLSLFISSLSGAS